MNNLLKNEFSKLIVIVLLFASSTIKAQTNTGNSLLWEVSGNGLEKPSYVFGILKFIPSDDYFLPAVVVNKMEACEILSTETLLDHHAKHELNKAAHLPHHESLDKYLTAKNYVKLHDLFKERLDINDLKFNLVYKKFKPIMLSTTMTRLAIGDVHFYEFDLINKAQEMEMLTMGLETVEREVEALESFAIEDQVKYLNHTITNFDTQLADYKKLVDAYKLGDLQKANQYATHPVEDNENFRKHFIVERNKEWLPKMKSYMEQAPTFFAIGISHLGKEFGLVHLLEEQGYTVTPIDSVKKK